MAYNRLLHWSSISWSLECSCLLSSVSYRAQHETHKRLFILPGSLLSSWLDLSLGWGGGRALPMCLSLLFRIPAPQSGMKKPVNSIQSYPKKIPIGKHIKKMLHKLLSVVVHKTHLWYFSVSSLPLKLPVAVYVLKHSDTPLRELPNSLHWSLLAQVQHIHMCLIVNEAAEHVIQFWASCLYIRCNPWVFTVIGMSVLSTDITRLSSP